MFGRLLKKEGITKWGFINSNTKKYFEGLIKKERQENSVPHLPSIGWRWIWENLQLDVYIYMVLENAINILRNLEIYSLIEHNYTFSGLCFQSKVNSKPINFIPYGLLSGI